jgi:hypothetical protein
MTPLPKPFMVKRLVCHIKGENSRFQGNSIPSGAKFAHST